MHGQLTSGAGSGDPVAAAPLRAPAALARAATHGPLTLLLGTLAVRLVAPEALSAAGPALLAVAVVVGLPHGAVDHLLPMWSGTTLGGARFFALLAGYAAAAAAALAAVLVYPQAVLVLLALAALHFGCGEVAVAAWRSGVRPSVSRVALAVVAVALMITAAPPALHPQITDPVLAALHPALPDLLAPGLRTGLLAVGLASGCVAAALAWLEGDALAAVELLLLGLLVVVVPPLTAFAVFFGGWHAWRHTLRMLDEDPGNAELLAAGDVWSALRRFLRAAAPTTAAAAVVLVALAALARAGAPASAIAVLLALTVPHAVAVGWLDVRLARGLRSTARPAP